MAKQRITILANEFTIHRFEAEEPIPKKIFESKYYWIGKTEEELSVVCDSKITLNSSKSDGNWSILKLIGQFDFSVVGILADITRVLSEAGISIVALSTYDTDYIMVKTTKVHQAKKVLIEVGYKFD
jgi:hypothetical protein